MQFVRNSLFMRSTTMFGVCEALGEDFKVSPTWFRVAFAATVIYNLEYAVLAYAVAGALVLISRLVYPSRRAAAPVAAEAAPVEVKAEVQPVAPAAPAAPALAEAA